MTSTDRYAYDYAGNRVKKQVNEQDSIFYVTDTKGLAMALTEITEAGEEVAYYTIGDERISMSRGDKTWYYGYDGHQDVRFLSDATGAVTDTYSYDAWGNQLTKTGDTTNEYLYNGESWDANTGLYYLRARYTKSSLELGKKVHKEYKTGDVDNITKFKEYVLPSGKRVDYIDFETKTVYELKPHNPNQIRNGNKQLQNYLEEIENVFGEGWTSVLDTY